MIDNIWTSRSFFDMFQHVSKTINSGEAVGNQIGIKTSLCLFVICNVVKLYPETDNILEICNVSASDTYRNYFH
jgi:hypothetical protein